MPQLETIEWPLVPLSVPSRQAGHSFLLTQSSTAPMLSQLAGIQGEVLVTDPSVSGGVSRGEPVLIGKHVGGRYRLVDDLGSGAFGTVYRAEDDATGHLVAVRLLPPALASASAAARSIQHASRSLPSVSAMHPALTRVLDYGETEAGQPFVA